MKSVKHKPRISWGKHDGFHLVLSVKRKGAKNESYEYKSSGMKGGSGLHSGSGLIFKQ